MATYLPAILLALFMSGAVEAQSTLPPFTLANTGAQEGNIEKMRQHLDSGELKGTKEELNLLLNTAVIYGKKEAALWLLERGAELEGVVRANVTPLLAAAQYREGDTTFYELLRIGASPYAQDANGCTIYHYLARTGNKQKIDAVARYDIDGNTKDSGGQTALHMAAASNNVEAIECFIALGVDIEAKDVNGHTALRRAWDAPHENPMFTCGPSYYDEEVFRYWGAVEAFNLLYQKGASSDFIPWMLPATLMKFVEADNAKLLAFAIEKGANPFTKFEDQTSLLHLAARWNSQRSAKYLIEERPKVDAIDFFGETPLIVACRRGSFEVTKLLVEAGANVNYIPQVPESNRSDKLFQYFSSGGPHFPQPASPLAWAIPPKRHDLIRYLLENDADPNLTVPNVEPPLHVAMAHGDTTSVEMLLDFGADASLKDRGGQSPLDRAFKMSNRSFIDLLQAAGAKIDLGETVHISLGKTEAPILHQKAAEGDMKMIEYLIENGYNPNHFDGTHQTAAFYATQHNRADVLELLQRHGTVLEVENSSHMNCLEYAAQLGAEDALYFLLRAGVNPNAPGRTPIFFYLAKYISSSRDTSGYRLWTEKFTRMSQSLLKYGADPLAPNGKVSLLDAALETKNPILARIALDAGADPVMLDKNGRTYLHRLGGAYPGNGSNADVVLEYGADPNARDMKGNTPLHIAVSRSYPESDTNFAKSLLKHGADPNATAPNGRTPLFDGIINHQLEFVAILLKAGANPEIRDTKGIYPLSLLAASRDLELIKLLCKAGADVNRRVVWSAKPSYVALAAGYSHFDTVRLLLEFGADPNVQDDSGSTALHYVASSNYPNEGSWAVEALLKAGANPGTKDINGRLPIDIARGAGNAPVIALLEKAMKK